MLRIDKMDIFTMVVEAIERNDSETASELMQIISKSIKKEKKSNKFLQQIEINNKKDEKLVKQLLNNDKKTTVNTGEYSD